MRNACIPLTKWVHDVESLWVCLLASVLWSTGQSFSFVILYFYVAAKSTRYHGNFFLVSVHHNDCPMLSFRTAAKKTLAMLNFTTAAKKTLDRMKSESRYTDVCAAALQHWIQSLKLLWRTHLAPRSVMPKEEVWLAAALCLAPELSEKIHIAKKMFASAFQNFMHSVWEINISFLLLKTRLYVYWW